MSEDGKSALVFMLPLTSTLTLGAESRLFSRFWMRIRSSSSSRLNLSWSGLPKALSKESISNIGLLQRQRQERKKALEEGEEDISNLPVRERFFRNQSSGRITRLVRQQSIPEQIRASRLSRRNSDYTRSGSPGTILNANTIKFVQSIKPFLIRSSKSFV
jgi:hypothetical protein